MAHASQASAARLTLLKQLMPDLAGAGFEPANAGTTIHFKHVLTRMSEVRNKLASLDVPYVSKRVKAIFETCSTTSLGSTQ
jgi:hypothetical protein